MRIWVGTKLRQILSVQSYLIWPAIIFVLLVNLYGFSFPIHQDEVVFQRISEQLHEGKVLYKETDFDFKPPGIFGVWYIANNVEQGGEISPIEGLGRVRVVVALINLISAWLVYRIAKVIRSNKRLSIIAGLSYLILLSFYQGQFGLTEPFMVMWLLGGIYYLFKLKVKNQKLKVKVLSDKFLSIVNGQMFLVGLFLGMAVVFNQKAVVNVVVVIGWVVMMSFPRRQESMLESHTNIFISIPKQKKIFDMDPRDSSELIVEGLRPASSRLTRFHRTSRNDRQAFWFLTGVVIPWLPVLAYLYINSALPHFWHAVAVYPLTQYPTEFGETVRQFPRLVWPILFLTLMSFWQSVIRQRRRRSAQNLKADAGQVCLRRPASMTTNQTFQIDLKSFLWLFVLVPLPLILTRPYHHYWLQILPFFILLVISLRDLNSNNLRG